MMLEPDEALKALLSDVDSGLRDRLLLPREAAYDAARSVFNTMIDRRPLAVVQCVDAADVAWGIVAAQRLGVPLCVRAGGHNVAAAPYVRGL